MVGSTYIVKSSCPVAIAFEIIDKYKVVNRLLNLFIMVILKWI